MDVHIQNAYNYKFEGLNILECGAHYEGGETREFRKTNNCYYIDAEKKAIDHLIHMPGINRANVFSFALSDSDGEVEFIETSQPGNSSFNHLPEHIEELIHIQKSLFRKVKVESKSYKTFLEMIGKTIDVLILDIEGGETFVLRGMKDLPVSSLPKIICIEAGYDWAVRKQMLLDLGYIIDFYDYNNIVLHHSSFVVSKNEEYVRQMNLQNKQFVWYGKVIFENDIL